MRNSKILSMIMLIVTLGLAACGGSESTTSKAQAKHGPVPVYPAVGEQNGVVRQGTSTLDDPRSVGLTYRCKSNLDSVKVDFLNTVEYNGTAIKWDEVTHDYDSKYSDMDQEAVKLVFSGAGASELANQATSLIVSLGSDSTDDNEGEYIFSDDKAANLTPDHIKQGLILASRDFDDGSTYISGLTLCVKKS